MLTDSVCLVWTGKLMKLMNDTVTNYV